jgi:hypothetical protein
MVHVAAHVQDILSRPILKSAFDGRVVLPNLSKTELVAFKFLRQLEFTSDVLWDLISLVDLVEVSLEL